MLSYIYCWKHLKQYYEVSRGLGPALKLFVWGQNDFVAVPELCSDMAYEYLYGDLWVKSKDFMKALPNENILKFDN